MGKVLFYVRSESGGVKVGGTDVSIGRDPAAAKILQDVFGHQASHFTERDLVLLLALALEGKRTDAAEVSIPLERIAGMRGWASNPEDVRKGIQKRFDGRVHVGKGHAHMRMDGLAVEFEDKSACEAFLNAPQSARTLPPRPGAGYQKAWYVRRTEQETEALNALEEPGSPAIIKAPRRSGKTWLIQHLVDEIRSLRDGSVCMDVSMDAYDRASPEQLFAGIARQIAETFELEVPATVSQGELTTLMRKCLAMRPRGRVVLVMDVPHSLSRDLSVGRFSEVLRAWSDMHGRRPWDRLRLLLGISRPPRMRHSVFNSLPIELWDFNDQEIEALATSYGVDLDEGDVDRIGHWTHGCPYLVALVLDAVVGGMRRVADVLPDAGPEDTPLVEHIASLQRWLKEEDSSALRSALRSVAEKAVSDRSDIYLDLEAAGLIRWDSRQWKIRCELYKSLTSD